MNKVEQEEDQYSGEETNINSVSINSIHFNTNYSILTVILKMSAGPNNMTVPYKVDTSSDVNLMPLHIYKNCFLKTSNEQLAATKNKNILLTEYKKLQ